MYHSITIKTLPGRGSGSLTFNTYKDFYLVPTALPVISTPGVKSKTIDIPGANGSLDLTESLIPYPVYNNRSGSLEFALLQDRIEYYTRYKNAPYSISSKYANDSTKMWAIIYSDILNKIHGRKCQIILEDDPEWYYEGRIALNQWQTSTDGTWPLITFDYDLLPYKLSIELSTDNWKWDPFSFIDGVATTNSTIPSNFTSDGLWKNITVNTSSYTTYGLIRNNSTIMNRYITGWMPACPSITVSGTNMGIKITNPELGYTYTKEYTSNGTFTDPECLLYDYLGNGYTIQLKGQGTFTISFRRGSL